MRRIAATLAVIFIVVLATRVIQRGALVEDAAGKG